MVTFDASLAQKQTTISEESVAAALDGLIHDSERPSSKSLENLNLIDEAMIEASWSQQTCNRKYFVAQILSDMITGELTKCREALGFSYPSPEASREFALERIGADTSGLELRGWSCLYYYYIRDDLDISVRLFCQAACINLRTFTRDKRRAIRRLAFRLTAGERMACETQRKCRLRSQLPMMPSPVLYGRSVELDSVSTLCRTLAVAHFQVIGAKGVGKTAFVYGAVKTLIEENAIDELVWFDAPSSVLQLRQQLTGFMRKWNSAVSLREFLQCRRVAFVFDNIPRNDGVIEYLETLLYELESAIVFLLTSLPIRLSNVMSYIVLSELEEVDAKRLIRARLGQWHIACGEAFVPEDVQYVWEYARGDPGAIERTVHNLQLERAKLVTKIRP